jgi:hypothetical protein
MVVMVVIVKIVVRVVVVVIVVRLRSWEVEGLRRSAIFSLTLPYKNACHDNPGVKKAAGEED